MVAFDDVWWFICISVAPHHFRRLCKFVNAHSLISLELVCTSDFCSFISKERSFFSKFIPIDPVFFCNNIILKISNCDISYWWYKFSLWFFFRFSPEIWVIFCKSNKPSVYNSILNSRSKICIGHLSSPEKQLFLEW